VQLLHTYSCRDAQPLKAIWSLYVPPSLTFKTAAFCPHSCVFLWISVITSLYSIQWLAFITETQCGYCATPNEYLNIIFVPWLRRLVAGLAPRKPGFDPRSVPVRSVVNRVALGQVFPCQCHSTSVPYSSSPTCCSSQKEKRARPGNLQTSTFLPDTGEFWIAK
jgi:hypothetical protein